MLAVGAPTNVSPMPQSTVPDRGSPRRRPSYRGGGAAQPRIARGTASASSGKFGGISVVEEGSDGRPRGVALSLSGLDADLLSKVQAGNFRGRDADVYFMLFNLTTQQPVTDPWVVWSGLMDVMRYTIDAGKFDLSLSCESRLIRLTRANFRRRTDEDQQKLFPGDRFFEFVDQLAFHKVQIGGTTQSPGAKGGVPGSGGEGGPGERSHPS